MDLKASPQPNTSRTSLTRPDGRCRRQNNLLARGEGGTVIAYLRVSTDEQCDRGTIERQRLHIERYAARTGASIEGVYTDGGVSGVIPLAQRPAGAHVLHAARHGRVDLVLVYTFHQLGRDYAAVTAIPQLLDLGVTMSSLTQADIDVRTSAGWTSLLQEIDHAAHEYAMCRQRSIDGTDRLVRTGAWVGGLCPLAIA